ncbi:MAG: CaiB/BaiF CoA-transferase family protein [Bacteroidota bacterium]
MLNGIKIVDFTRLLPGPLATHLLSQMGANVVKIEHPKRMDYLRYYGPQVDGASPFFHSINYLKTKKTIDYQNKEGKKAILEIIRTADVLVEQFRPGVMKSWGLDYASLKSINPKLVYVSLTGYGQDNVMSDEAGHDINYMAYSGLLDLLRDEKGKPVVPGFQLGDIGSGAYMVVMAVQSGLIQQLKTGQGAHLDVSMTKGLLPLLTVPVNMEWNKMPHELFNTLNGKTMVNYAVYECADGKWLSLGAVELKFWNNFCETVERPQWKRDNELELSVLQFPKQELIDFFKQKTRDEWTLFFKGKDVCIAPVLAVDELDQQEYLAQINAFETFETEQGSPLKTVALPFQLL